MRTTLKLTAAVAAAAALTLGLSACSAPSDTSSSSTKKGKDADPAAKLIIAASPTPHSVILEYVRDHLAKDAGLKLEVKQYNDYNAPNTTVQNGEVDGNFFQHKPYLDDFNKKNKTDIVPVVNVEIEPLGLYSKKVKKVSDLGEGATIAVPNDATNEGRALKLLADNNVIELKDGVGASATLKDVKDAKGVKFTEIEAAQIPPRLADVDAAVINGNFAIGAKLNPAKDSLALEKAEGNPYANFLAVKKGNEQDPRIVKLAKLLNSDEVKKFIEEKFSNGAVIPAFGPAKS
ncbi:MetQ/NlpA family ABC transporter substrate-binding protein [Streptomyces mobaraensis NBRC 13819 = DSM 40847]|uniref:Lipoprotein n=1 Tax=Streptomyces mobaraensis (strain ATCC 29032 / DSM 40847 / JCM 4168 / NBRC 13819 / NCIMB 11159 / IPCR 16-22) TaxID=1223523 RepID=M3B476_STRM1|nr:MetQ/NlpA family ABC transporter substrate-binding protein [Streptomyces mobaraensis]EMF00793.1 ABC transporter substrate-binding protein [Streptomyces mobaraensis NBRC 13819 = DSM 40847]QTT72923.1 MetQ/NlpA family ABC transporter substrate-binding protein [Streptomyces mobaraensis NBRC 13819 = DSM 40847]